jgi:predicted Zn finger-like uncharacterized protein
MIISCEQCKKKFEVDNNLIPAEGRLLECSSCSHQWFYHNIINNLPKEVSALEEKIFITTNNVKKKISVKNNINKKNIKKNNDKNEFTKETNSKKNISFLNLILVFIITFFACLLIGDTFMSPLKEFIPNIDLIINSLYETFEDIYLFIQNLI